MSEQPKLNLSWLQAEAASEDTPVEIPLHDRDGEPYVNAAGKPITASVLGEYSAPVRRQIEQNQKALGKLRRPQLTPEMHTANRHKVATAGLSAWGMEDADGQPIPTTLQAVAQVCETAPWILDQLEDGMRRHASFFKSTSKG